ncbi:MAG TPA: hypothetical protein VGW74_06980 [Propionibacteriaceae bacterium]|nr:hypothetical protein [Propionibacteriaceae bacterium]
MTTPETPDTTREPVDVERLHLEAHEAAAKAFLAEWPIEVIERYPAHADRIVAVVLGAALPRLVGEVAPLRHALREMRDAFLESTGTYAQDLSHDDLVRAARLLGEPEPQRRLCEDCGERPADPGQGDCKLCRAGVLATPDPDDDPVIFDPEGAARAAGLKPVCEAFACPNPPLTTEVDGAGRSLDLCEEHGDDLASGFPLKRRPWTPDEKVTNPDGTTSTRFRVKTACTGCGALLGDVTDREIEDAIEGRPLSDTTAECPVCSGASQ